MTNNEIVKQYPAWATEGFGDVYFADYHELEFVNDPLYSVDYLCRICLSYSPLFVRLLMRIRDIMVSPFGLITGDAHRMPEALYFEKGSVLAYFHVWERGSNTIVLQEIDKHLNFRVLLMVERNEIANELCFRMSTIVHFNNILGQIYFIPVNPFHQIIMKSVIKSILKQIRHEKQ